MTDQQRKEIKEARAYFAGLALQGLLANSTCDFTKVEVTNPTLADAAMQALVSKAWLIGSAMVCEMQRVEAEFARLERSNPKEGGESTSSEASLAQKPSTQVQPLPNMKIQDKTRGETL